MNARTAIRRIIARRIADPNFDATEFPGVEELVRDLRRYFPDLSVNCVIEKIGLPEAARRNRPASPR